MEMSHLKTTPAEIAKSHLDEAKQELNIFVASHFRSQMTLDLTIVDLTTMKGSVTFHPGGETSTIDGYMIGDTDWCFQLAEENPYLQETAYIPFDVLEDYIDDIETAEQDYGVHVVPNKGE